MSGAPVCSIREARQEDLPAIDRIQRTSPEAVIWTPEEYLFYPALVAVTEPEEVAGFILYRDVFAGEREILNLAVAPAWRRQGIGGALLKAALRDFAGVVFLEVRSSNEAGKLFYARYGFFPIARREKYYRDTGEDAVVLRFQSC